MPFMQLESWKPLTTPFLKGNEWEIPAPPVYYTADWGMGQMAYDELWPFGIIMMDILLCVGAGVYATNGCLLTITAWVVVRCVEDIYRLGIWDFPYSTGEARGASGKTLAFSLIHRLLPLLLDSARPLTEPRPSLPRARIRLPTGSGEGGRGLSISGRVCSGQPDGQPDGWEVGQPDGWEVGQAGGDKHWI
eukprot:gene17059-biopygen2919